MKKNPFLKFKIEFCNLKLDFYVKCNICCEKYNFCFRKTESLYLKFEIFS